jgi:hypothetical protein
VLCHYTTIESSSNVWMEVRSNRASAAGIPLFRFNPCLFLKENH